MWVKMEEKSVCGRPGRGHRRAPGGAKSGGAAIVELSVCPPTATLPASGAERGKVGETTEKLRRGCGEGRGGELSSKDRCIGGRGEPGILFFEFEDFRLELSVFSRELGNHLQGIIRGLFLRFGRPFF